MDGGLFLARYSGVFGRPGARPDGKTAPTTASASRTSPVDGGRFRVVPKGRADRPLNLANAVRTSACGTKDDDGWPGKRCAAPVFTPRIAPVALGRLWQQACKATIWQATVVARPMRQHSCYRAAAWSTAGALADGNGRRAGRSRARRAPSRAIRRLPRCAAPSTSNWHTHGTRPCLDAGARRCAGGWHASGGDGGALRQRPLGASGPRRHRVLLSRASGCGVGR